MEIVVLRNCKVTIDAMTEHPFKGNPTPVFVLKESEEWPIDFVLQMIAR